MSEIWRYKPCKRVEPFYYNTLTYFFLNICHNLNKELLLSAVDLF